MKRAVIFALLALAACEKKDEKKVRVEVEQKQAEAQPKMSDEEILAKCRKRGEDFFNAMGFVGSAPSCYKSEKDGIICQLPESSKRKVHVIDCNTDGCNYRGGTEY